MIELRELIEEQVASAIEQGRPKDIKHFTDIIMVRISEAGYRRVPPVEEMPLAENQYPMTTRWDDPRYLDRLSHESFQEGTEAQRQIDHDFLMKEQPKEDRC